MSLDGRGTLFSQLHRALRQQVLAGQLAPGARLGSTRALSRELGLSRSTVSAVYDQLLAEGYLEARRGSGTFVAAELPSPVLVEPASPGVAPVPRLSAFGKRLQSGELGYPYDAIAAKPRVRYELMYGLVDGSLFPSAAWRRRLGKRLSAPRSRGLGYAPPEGSFELRHAIAEQLARSRGVRCRPQQVIVTSGAQQALSLIARVLVDRGTPVLIEDPSYVGSRRILAAEGARLRPVPVDDEGIQLSALPARALRAARLAIVTPSHQFPTGVVMSLARRLELLDWARSADAFVIEDDYDGEFRYEGRPVESLHALDREQRVIYVGTFSKTLAPALRLGFLIAPEPLAPALRAAKWLADWSSPTLVQYALADFLRDGELSRHVRRLRGVYGRRRRALIDALEGELGDAVAITGAAAGLHFVVGLPKLRPSALPRLIEATRAAGVGIHSIAPYYAAAPPRAGLIVGHTRLNEAEIAQAVRLFARAYRAQCG